MRKTINLDSVLTNRKQNMKQWNPDKFQLKRKYYKSNNKFRHVLANVNETCQRSSITVKFFGNRMSELERVAD